MIWLLTHWSYCSLALSHQYYHTQSSLSRLVVGRLCGLTKLELRCHKYHWQLIPKSHKTRLSERGQFVVRTTIHLRVMANYNLISKRLITVHIHIYIILLFCFQQNKNLDYEQQNGFSVRIWKNMLKKCNPPNSVIGYAISSNGINLTNVC